MWMISWHQLWYSPGSLTATRISVGPALRSVGGAKDYMSSVLGSGIRGAARRGLIVRELIAGVPSLRAPRWYKLMEAYISLVTS